MDFNFHTHTVRCSHATGSEEEYIERAIANGIRYMGFSDHAPHRHPDGTELQYRVQTADCEDYISTVKRLAKKYKEKLELHVGFEMEYYPIYFDEMLEYARNSGAEYLILGQHQIGSGHPDLVPSTLETTSLDSLKSYVCAVTSGMLSGVFTYVAHPDMINFKGEREVYFSEMSKICELSLKNDIPLEINGVGIRCARNYPNPLFWELCGKIGSPVTIGFDAHDAPAAYDDKTIETAKTFIKKYNLNYIGKPNLIPIV